MRAVVVYESMYGNTKLIAEAVGQGLADSFGAGNVTVVPVADATSDRTASAALVVVGGPTHVHGMSGPRTRRAAVQEPNGRPGRTVVIEPGATGEGLREWLPAAELTNRAVACFDTRAKGPAVVTGRAAVHYRRELLRAGARLVVPPRSFLVTRANALVPGQLAAARLWGRDLAAAMNTGAGAGRGTGSSRPVAGDTSPVHIRRGGASRHRWEVQPFSIVVRADQ